MPIKRQAAPVPFQKGDLVAHLEKEDGDDSCGNVVGFCPSNRWVRVRTLDKRYRIWLKDNVHNVDADLKEGNYAGGIHR